MEGIIKDDGRDNERVVEQCMKTMIPMSSLCSVTTYWQWHGLMILLPGEITVRMPVKEKIFWNSSNQGLLIAE
jgi:hypothetical protein